MTATWRRSPSVLTRYTPRSIVLSTEHTPEPVRVTGAAMLVWSSLTGAQTTEEVVHNVARAAGVPPDAVDTTARDALRELVDLGAVVGC